ncbi:MAG: uracil-DNA glycosylase [Campylobacter sp.]|nr:uracil-DNA glycosylase [Campylobacter sp.]
MSKISSLYFYKALGYKFIDEVTVKKIDNFRNLSLLCDALKSCELCSCSKTREHVLMPSMHASEILVVYESPTNDQNLTGNALASELALRFKDTLLEYTKLDKEQISESFLVKCYNPKGISEQNIKMCASYLFEEIDKVSPKLILAIGLRVSEAILKSDINLEVVHGSVFRYKSSLVMPLFSLNFLLKNPSKKEAFFADIKKIKELI